MPPSAEVTKTYLHWPTSHLFRSRGHEHVRERERVGAGDLDLPLDADVPQRDAVQELPVLLDRVAVVARVVHVVVEAVQLHAVAA